MKVLIAFESGGSSALRHAPSLQENSYAMRICQM
jgi:hypothetical protein